MGLVLAIVTFLAPEYWIERLGAESIEAREDAARWLKDLGWAAMPALLAAERHPDPEIAERVAELLSAIPLRDRLSPELRQALPGVEDRLAGGDEAWLHVFLEAARLPQIPTRDLEFLIEPASRAARSPDEKTEVLRFLLRARIVWTMRLLAGFLSDPDVARLAWQGFDGLGPRLRVETLAWFLEEKHDLGPLVLRRVRALDPVDVFRCLDLRRAGALRLAFLLRDEGRLRSREVIDLVDSVPLLLPLVHDRDPVVRMAAVARITRVVQ